MLSRIKRVSAVVAILFLLASNPRATIGQSRPVAGTTDLREMIQQFSADQRSLLRTYAVFSANSRRERMKRFYDDSLVSLKLVDFDRLNQDGKIDYVVLQHYLNHRLHVLTLESQQYAEMSYGFPSRMPLQPWKTRAGAWKHEWRAMRRDTIGDGQRDCANKAGGGTWVSGRRQNKRRE